MATGDTHKIAIGDGKFRQFIELADGSIVPTVSTVNATSIAVTNESVDFGYQTKNRYGFWDNVLTDVAYQIIAQFRLVSGKTQQKTYSYALLGGFLRVIEESPWAEIADDFSTIDQATVAMGSAVAI